MPNLNRIASVSISAGARFPSRAGFGILNAFTNQLGVIGIAERVRAYTSAPAVAADFGDNAEVTKLATSYFGQNPKPSTMYVTTRFESSQPAELRGGGIEDNATNLALFTAVTDGAFNITIDGVDETLTGIDLSSETTLAGVAAELSTELALAASGATVSYAGGRFIARSGTTGASSTISFATSPGSGTDLSTLLQWQQGQAIKSNGIAGETITASLNAAANANNDFFGIIFTKEMRDGATVNSEAGVIAASNFAAANNKVFFNTTNDPDATDSATTNDIGSQLQDASASRTITTFSSHADQYPSASVAGKAFGVNFSAANSTITLNFKTLPQITVESLSKAEFDALEAKNINVAVTIAGINMFTEGKMADGIFFDEVHGLAWLQNAIQTNAAGFIATRATKVPYTDEGTAQVGQQIINALEEGVRNGLLAPGTLSTGEFLAQGYRVNITPVANSNLSDVEARQYRGYNFTCKGAGALHGVDITGVFER